MRLLLKNFIFCIFAILFLSNQAIAETISGKVIGVHDGDTITLLTQGEKKLKIRLTEIDAPELAQSFGAKSKQMLSDLIFNKDVTVYYDEVDQYKRILGRVKFKRLDANLEMVRLGGAWAYYQYLKDLKILKAEQEAKTAKIGLWALQKDQIIPPWDWRRNKRNKSKNKTTDQLPQSLDGDKYKIQNRELDSACLRLPKNDQDECRKFIKSIKNNQ